MKNYVNLGLLALLAVLINDSPTYLKEMSNNGMIIGGHTVNHKVLSKLNYEEQDYEISNSIDFIENEIHIISNYDANSYNDSVSIKKNLQNQMANQVKWTQSIKKLEEIGENKIIEIGPNKVLSGLINRISKNFDIRSINLISDI